MREEVLCATGKRFRSSHLETVVVEDIFISPSEQLSIVLAGDHLHILFPIVGKLVLADSAREISPEELLCYCGSVAKEVTVSNPFPDDKVNFLHIGIKKTACTQQSAELCFCTLNIDRKNGLIQPNGLADSLKVGVYDSRVKDKMSLTDTCNGLFTCILNGSFDFEERLMEYRDSLMLWDIEEVTFEALSENAIILFVECSLLK